MKLNWSKWFYDLGNMLIRHVGTAGLVWGGLSVKHRHELNAELWWDLGASLLCGAILPTVFTFFQSGLPPAEDDAPLLSLSPRQSSSAEKDDSPAPDGARGDRGASFDAPTK